MESIGEFALKLAQKLGCDYAEARTESTKSNAIILKNGNPEIIGFDKTTGIGIRLLKKNSLAFVSTNQMDKETVKKLIQKSIKNINSAGKISEKVELDNEKARKKKYVAKQKIKLDNVTFEEKMEILMEIEKAIKQNSIKVPSRYFSLSDHVTEKEILTTEGTKIFSELPRVNFFYLTTVAKNNKTAQRYWQLGAVKGFEAVNEWKLHEKIPDELRLLAKNLEKGRKTVPGEYDLVLGPEVAGIIAHESCGHPYEADRILGREAAQAGESFMKPEMIGKSVAKNTINVVDDPTIEGSYGFYLYDDEGVKAKRKWLIKEGKTNELLHNRQTAKALGVKSNASSRASSYDREAIVRMSNTFFLPGKMKEEELIEGIKKGIYLKNFTEWNIDDKRLNQKYVGAESYLIENGRITRPLLNPILEITTPELYSIIDAVADNLELHAATCGKGEPMQGIAVTMGGPSIRLRKARIK
jgi:TldD protein